MKTLFDFQVPNNGEIAICELNGKTQYINPEYGKIETFTKTVENHPRIHITRDQLHSVSSRDEGKALFLPVDVTFLKQLSQIYYEQGAVEALHLAKSHTNFFISEPAKIILTIHKYVQKVRLILNPNIQYSGLNLINQLSQTKNWLNSTIRFLSWHPYCTKLAVVTSDDCVRIFSSEISNYSPILRCKQQRNISCVAWRPLSNTDIAVAHETGIIIWNIDPNSLVLRPSVSNATILYRLGHSPIISIAWSPKGDHLISVAACDNTILVWNPELDRTSSLKRPGGCGNVLVKWSPTGEKIFTCSDRLVFRVWDYRNWECERWTILSGRIQSACWSNCGTTLFFATTTEPLIYGVIVKNDLIFANQFESSSQQALPMFDVSKCDFEGIPLGGLIQCIDSDPKGKHLAVLFADSDVVAIFNVSRQPSLQLLPNSLIMGLAEEKPTFISFQQNFQYGSCLTIAWSTGRIQYFPLIYSDLASSASRVHNDNNSSNNVSLYK